MAHDYDVICIGGGLGGAALAKALAENGARVLILERETSFRDRNRGELMHPWGIAEARRLGLYDLFKETCGLEVRYRDSRMAGAPPPQPRDLIATTPNQAGSLTFHHPEMQEVTLAAAQRAGAEARRGVTVTGASTGTSPTVRLKTPRGEEERRARLVVGADGRDSFCRAWGGFSVTRDPDRMALAGALFAGLSAPDDAYHNSINSPRGEVCFQIPLGRSRFRCYFSYYLQNGRTRFSGRRDERAFIEASIASGAPPEWFEGAELAGPLSTFNGTESWVEHPYREGFALIGDAASTSDPTFGCGLSLTARDARVLSECLLAGDNWDAAAHAYAEEHQRYAHSLHRLLGWMTDLLFEPGPYAAARRERAWERVAEAPGCLPDIAGLGPEFPSDDDAYRNLFGDD